MDIIMQKKLNFTWCKDTIIDAVGNDIFTAIFIKKDGSERKMTCRFVADKGELAIGEHDRILTVKEMLHKPQFRRVSLDSLISLKHNGITYKFN
tara:strand:- start:1792 stop:2073 length:282 start_codon:yes stop_codon:yes gene_type:complete